MLANNPKIKSEKPTQKVKPPPFFVSLIIGDKIVHNCMIDSGASSSIMPKSLVYKLGLTYEPLSKGVVQLNEYVVKTTGVIKNLALTLHACPNFVIPKISMLLTYRLIFPCLSRDFTTKLGGFLSFNWSHLFLKTIDGTNVTIKSKPQAKFHIEPCVPSPINANLYITHELKDQSMTLDPNTPIKDVNLDEGAALYHKVDPFSHTSGVGLGIYMIQEHEVPTPNLLERVDHEEVKDDFFQDEIDLFCSHLDEGPIQLGDEIFGQEKVGVTIFPGK